MESIRSALTTIAAWLDWLPDPIAALSMLALAAAIALVLHHWARKAGHRLLAQRYPSLLAIVTQLRGVTRLALLILAMIVAIPAAPLDPDFAAVLARVLVTAIIGLAGWAAIVALRIAADVYLLRFRLESADNLLARKHTTQVRVLLRTVDVLVVLVTIGAALMTFPAVRQYGVSLFASAGVAGIVAGLAARPVLSNLIAGVQLAMTQPIRIDDAVVVEGEWGMIEEITSTYVVVRIWDLRRLIVPLSYFIEKPFQNWTRDSSAIIGAVLFYLDYRAPVAVLREKLVDICQQSKNWNGKTAVLQVTDAKESTIELRALVSANSAGQAFDLRCEVREKMIDFLQREHPEALPRQRQLNLREDGAPATVALLSPAPEKPAEGERPAARR
jgi:small-conductance mechanosensitive channel